MPTFVQPMIGWRSLPERPLASGRGGLRMGVGPRRHRSGGKFGMKPAICGISVDGIEAGATMQLPLKATETDFVGRFREIISDPLNLLIERVPMAGTVQGNEVFLHNGNRVPLTGAAAYYGAFSQI
jgi:hypothetical protein